MSFAEVMATLNLDINHKCPICVGIYKEPRKLPGCAHSLCEDCILNYVLNLEKEVFGLDFPCPVCRLPSAIPDNKEITIEWVRTMNKDFELASMANEHTEEIGENLCSPCTFLSKSTTSTHFCMNCREYICGTCSETVHAGKQNRNHTVMETEGCSRTERLRAPAIKLMSQLLTCSEHPEQAVKLYCELHGDLVCCLCAAMKHASCNSLREIKDIPKLSLQTESETLINFSEKITEHLKLIIGVYKENETENKQDLEKIRSQIFEMKEKVVHLLDILEANVNQDSAAAAKKSSIRCLDEIDKLKEIEDSLNVFKYLIKNCLTGASEDHIYVCINKLKRLCQDIEMKIILKGNKFTKTGVQLKPTKFLSDVLKIGPNETSQLVTIVDKESTVSVPVYKDDSSERSYRIENISTTSVLPKTYKDADPTYNDILYLPDNKILLVDSYYGYCCLVDGKLQTITSKKFVLKEKSNRTHYMKCLHFATYMENNVIALSLATDKKLCFVSPDDLTIKGEIVCTRTPKALCALEKYDIAMSWEGPVAFSIISVQGGTYSERGYLTADNSGRQLKSFQYMAVDRKLRRVIQPCDSDKAVYCFSFDGEPIFKYENKDLESPRGVTVDCDSSIFVCSHGEVGCVHIVSQYGLVFKVIKGSFPNTLGAISINKDRSRLAVTQFSGGWDKVHIFSIVVERE